MYLWAGFYKTGTTSIEEALIRMGLGNYRSTSEKCGFFYTFKKMKNNNLFASMSQNGYLIITDNNYSIIANQVRDNNTLERELQLTKKFQVEEFFKIFYENNSNIQAFAKGKNGMLEQFVYESSDCRICYELAKDENDVLPDEYPFEPKNPFENVCDAIENITQIVLGKKIYAEFGELHEIELENFVDPGL
ncbi:MAG TPA: hypothetical protein VGE79_10500 [Niastella sp.]